jgi:hypothetical protein
MPSAHPFLFPTAPTLTCFLVLGHFCQRPQLLTRF